MWMVMTSTKPEVIGLVVSSQKGQKISKTVNKFCVILKTAASAVGQFARRRTW